MEKKKKRKGLKINRNNEYKEELLTQLKFCSKNWDLDNEDQDVK